MLPGIRFLLAAIVLSMSILIFGLGAAALLRAAHEEVASVPTRRILPEPVFAQQVEPPPPTLALTTPGRAATKTAALGSPAAKVEKPAETKKASEKPDRSEIKKQERAERAKERRRLAARHAKLAAQQAAAQQAADPFSQTVQ